MNLEASKIEEFPYLIKGLRYSFGYSLLDMPKIGLGIGLVGNWECRICYPDVQNWQTVQNLIKTSNKSPNELIKLGKLEFGSLIKDMCDKICVKEDILNRFVISKYLKRRWIKPIELGSCGISSKNKRILLNINEFIEKNREDDPRKIIFNLQKQFVLKNSNIPETKNMWEKASKYKEIISIYNRSEPFEKEMFILFDKLCDNLINNAVITDKMFKYITEADLYGKIGNKTVYISCKNTDFRKVINMRKNLVNKFNLVKEYINPNYLLLVCSCNVSNKTYFLRNNIKVIDKDMIKLINNNPKLLLNILNEGYLEDKININKLKFKRGKDIVNLLNLFRLSKYQFANLIEMNGGYICKVIDKNLDLTEIIKNKISVLIRDLDMNDFRKLHFMANKKIALKQDCFVFKRIREKLNLSQKEMAEKIKVDVNNVGNYERGLVICPCIKNKIRLYLKSFKEYPIYEKEAIKEFGDYKITWKNLLKSGKIIKMKGPPPKGYELENMVEKILKNQNWKVFKNVIVASKDLNFKKEVDIYAIKGKKEIIIECKDCKMNTMWKDVSKGLKNIKNCGINKIIYLSPYISDLGRKVLKEEGIIGIKLNELRSYLNGT